MTRDRQATIRVQPKGTIGLSPDDSIEAKVRRATFRPSAFDYLVFANFDPEVVALTPWAFVIRADQFDEMAAKRGEFLRFSGKPDPRSKGPWGQWLYRVDEIAGVFETALEVRRERAGAALPGTREEVVRERRALRMRVRGR